MLKGVPVIEPLGLACQLDWRSRDFFFFFDRTQELVFIQDEEQYRSEYKLRTSGAKQRKERGYKQNKLLQHTIAGAPSIFVVAEKKKNTRAAHTQAPKKPLARRR
jgi:hypothetical protein